MVRAMRAVPSSNDARRRARRDALEENAEFLIQARRIRSALQTSRKVRRMTLAPHVIGRISDWYFIPMRRFAR